jgi:hypothetical protein
MAQKLQRWKNDERVVVKHSLIYMCCGWRVVCNGEKEHPTEDAEKCCSVVALSILILADLCT